MTHDKPEPMHDRYKHSILKVCEDLTGVARGSYVTMTPDDEFQAQADWLQSRLDTWQESTFAACRAYDDAVFTLACTALNEWNYYLRRFNP